MDETYKTYLNRVAHLTLPATYQSQLPHIQESPKFKPLPDGSWQAVSFPGYSVVTPPWEEESENSAFYTKLRELQQQLLQQTNSGLIIPVPPDSFHLTLADLIWESAYRDVERENPEFEVQLQERISESFQKYQHSVPDSHPLCWQVLGLMIRPRAIAVCLVPKDEDTYERTLQFRRFIYQNPALIALGIEQQYHFTAHITLGYFGEISPELDRHRLSKTLAELNRQALPEDTLSIEASSAYEFCIRQVELRKFDDMLRYYRLPDWPVIEL